MRLEAEKEADSISKRQRNLTTELNLLEKFLSGDE